MDFGFILKLYVSQRAVGSLVFRPYEILWSRPAARVFVVYFLGAIP